MAIYAIFLNSLRLLLRRKAPAALIALISIAGPLSSYFMFTGDATLAGVLRMMMTYNYYLTSSALMLLTMYLAATVLDSELSEAQMLLTSSKPVPRWQILIGKWLAVAALTGGALLLSAAAGYAALTARCSPEQIIAIRQKSPQAQNFSREDFIKDAQKQAEQTRLELLTCRQPFRPQIPSIDEEFAKSIAAVKASGMPADKLPSDADIRTAIRRAWRKQVFPIAFDTGREFAFSGLPTGQLPLTVRYSVKGSRSPGELDWLQARWFFTGDKSRPPFVQDTDSRSGAVREFLIPGQLIPPTGVLNVVVANVSMPTKDNAPPVLELPFDKGINLLVPQGSFLGNYLRAHLLLWVRLLMLAAVGVGASAFLSGSVTTFLLFSLLVAGSLHGTVLASVAPSESSYIMKEPDISFQQYVSMGLLSLLPDFERTSALNELTTGTKVGWTYLGWQTFFDLLLRGGFFFVIGMYAFARRELGIPRIFR